jgi:hypothetical protein
MLRHSFGLNDAAAAIESGVATRDSSGQPHRRYFQCKSRLDARKVGTTRNGRRDCGGYLSFIETKKARDVFIPRF